MKGWSTRNEALRYSILHFMFPWMFYQVTRLFEALDKNELIEDHPKKEKGQVLINQEDIEMTSIVVPETD